MDPFIKFIPINTIPTKILIWDNNLKESDLDQISEKKFNYEKLILMISGNPGEIEYYRQYLAELYSETKLPVIGVSNAGHNRIPENLSKPDIIKKNEKCFFGLEAQILHKFEFIKNFINPKTRLIILAHSIGCFVTLELLERYPEINQMIDHCVLIFPTIQSLLKAENAICLETLLSQETKNKLLGFLLRLNGHPNTPDFVIESATNLMNPYCLKATIVMVLDEFRLIDLPNVSTIKSNANKLSLFYGEADHWAPIEYYKYLKEETSELSSNQLDLRLCLGKMDHAFVMEPKNVHQVVKLTLDVIKNKYKF